MTKTLKKRLFPVLALGLALAAGPGCIDNSGNKTYAHGGGSGATGGTDGDAGVATDADPDAAPDLASVDAPASDAAAGEVSVGDVAVDLASADGPQIDALAGDVHPDGTGN